MDFTGILFLHSLLVGSTVWSVINCSVPFIHSTICDIPVSFYCFCGYTKVIMLCVGGLLLLNGVCIRAMLNMLCRG